MSIPDLQIPYITFSPIVVHVNHDTLSGLTIKKTVLVASCMLTGAIVGAALALTTSLNAVVLTAAGILVGQITGFFLTLFIKNESQPEERTSINNFANANLVIRNTNRYSSSNEAVREEVVVLDQPVRDKFASEQKKNIEDLAQALEVHFEKNSEITSDTELDQLLDAKDQILANLLQQSQFQKLYTALKEEIGKELADQALRHPTLFSNHLTTIHSPLSKTSVQFLVRKAKCYFHNQNALDRLKHQMQEKFGHENVFDRVISEPNLKVFLEGRRLISAETENALLKCASEMQAKDHFEQLLETIRQACQRDLFLNDQFIENKFEVAKAIDSLPPIERQLRREALQRIINQAYVTRELKQKSHLIMGEKEEATLLTCLGHTIDDQSPYYQKELIYQIIQEMIQNELQPDLYTGPLQFIKDLIKDCALKGRLKAIGITEAEQVAKFQFAYNLFITIKEELKKAEKLVALSFPKEFPLASDSIIASFINETFTSLLSLKSERALKQFFQHVQVGEKFKDPAYLAVDFNEFLEGNQENSLNRQRLAEDWNATQRDELIQGEIRFFSKWGSNIKAQMMQGIGNDNQILGDGVCWGLCQRICLNGEMHPDLSPEEFAASIEITKEDRFFQGIHAYSTRLSLPNSALLPDPLLQREGLEADREVFNLVYDASESILDRWLEQHSTQLNSSAGWLRIGLTMENQDGESGHAIAIRLDTNRQRFWVFDPNIGLLCFEEKESNSTDCQIKAISFVTDLIRQFYPTTYKIRGYQHQIASPQALIFD